MCGSIPLETIVYFLLFESVEKNLTVNKDQNADKLPKNSGKWENFFYT